jgi:hypothetical protein
VHADGIGIGVDSDQQRGDGGPAAVRALYRLVELMQPFRQTCGGLPGIAAVRRTAGMQGVDAAEVIHANLEIARGRVCRIRHTLAPAPQFDRFPMPQRLLDIERGAGARCAVSDHRGRHPQDVIDHAAQTSIGARRDVDGMETPALNQQGGAFTLAQLREAAVEPARDQLAKGLEHAAGIQAAQVERPGPVRAQHRRRYLEAERRLEIGPDPRGERVIELAQCERA